MEKKTKYILLGLGVVAVGTGAYLYIENQKKQKASNNQSLINALTDGSASFPDLPLTTQQANIPNAPTTSTSPKEGFPLKKGSKGSLVTNLQNALIKKYGSQILPKYGADGSFGNETLNALKTKGFPSSVDSNTYTQILLSSGSSGASSFTTSHSQSKSSLANTIHSAILGRNFSKAMNVLGQIQSVNDYILVNTHFKKKKVGLVSMTLVTALLSVFRSNHERQQLTQAFYRIGLKYNGSQWSLSGLDGLEYQLTTIVPTKVWDQNGATLQVPVGTTLGTYVDAHNGVTEIETMDGNRIFVKTTTIKSVI